ncbi:MAG: peptide/nickel transport system ATP-binding protein [Actinomycetota bacterium]|jgi:peptide/nickel transport system ATP-binding protein|nr:peptide/nickel transport system ATP-binding protein [Actinomycetota bacterium]
MTTLEVINLRVSYGRGHERVRAVDNVSFRIPQAGVLGLVGESGSGKSTIARAIVGLAPIESGQVLLDDVPVNTAPRGRISMVFQDPFASLNPRMTIASALGEVVAVTGHVRRADRGREVARLLDLVHLTSAQGERFPAQLSGGQRQRAAIARALASSPSVLVADEITSALDVSVQATILNVLREVLARTQVSMLFISHNLSVVRYVSSEVAVMHCGQIVEYTDNQSLFSAPQHPYTEVLISSIPTLAAHVDTDATVVDGEPPDPGAPPVGCRFHPRCPVGPLVRPDRIACIDSDPADTAGQRVHRAACHFAAPATAAAAAAAPG